MTEKDKHSLMVAGMGLSLLVHMWVWAIGFHFWLEPYNVGAWLVLPLLATSLLTWLLVGGAICSGIEYMGWWDD